MPNANKLEQQSIDAERAREGLEIQKRNRWQPERDLRRKLGLSRDQEFAQVRENERQRINQLPFWSRTVALAEFEAQPRELEGARQSERAAELEGKGDVAALLGG